VEPTKKIQAKPRGRYDKELKKRVSWWEHGDERFPRTNFAAGSPSKKGHMVDLQTGEVDVRETAIRIVNFILDNKLDPAELLKGTKDEEKEHDMSPAKARKTASQHLRRVDPRYYTKTERCLKSPPKANVIGSSTAIGMSVGGA
jgi:hypothetical protein